MAALLAQFAAGALSGIGKAGKGRSGKLGAASSFIGALGIGGDVGGAATGRRRRRKALSESDMAQVAIIASTISKKAAENFMLRRVRSS